MIKGPEFSDRAYSSIGECKEFVNQLIQYSGPINIDNLWDNDNFKFITGDGTVFQGACTTAEKYTQEGMSLFFNNAE